MYVYITLLIEVLKVCTLTQQVGTRHQTTEGEKQSEKEEIFNYILVSEWGTGRGGSS